MIFYDRTENNAFKLWIPDNSDFVADNAWLEENSPPEIRFLKRGLKNRLCLICSS